MGADTKDEETQYERDFVRTVACSYCCRLQAGEFSMADTTTLIYRMAIGIYNDRKGGERSPNAYIPIWVQDLEMASDFGASEIGIDLKSYLWWRRALIYREAKNYSYTWEKNQN